MKKLLSELKLKADMCGDSTKEARARKGAYVDCILMCGAEKIKIEKIVKNFNELLIHTAPHISDSFAKKYKKIISQYKK